MLFRYMLREAKRVVSDLVVFKRPGDAVSDYKVVPLIGNKFGISGGSCLSDRDQTQAVAVSFPLKVLNVVAGVHFN